MKGEVKRQGGFLAEPIYESIIPKRHLLSRLLKLVDWEDLALEAARTATALNLKRMVCLTSAP